MSIGMLILGAIIVFCAMRFAMRYVLIKKIEKKSSLKTARTLCWIIPIVSAILGGLLFGYAGGTRLTEGAYPYQRCGICRDSVELGYKVNSAFSTYYYCEEHKDIAYELAGLTPAKSNRLEDSYGHDEFDAVAAAEKIVKSNLKSPSTAEFCKHKEYTITCSGDTWTIKGYVDAQNSFGATLRNNFTVKITFTSSTKYTIDLCSIK